MRKDAGIASRDVEDVSWLSTNPTSQPNEASDQPISQQCPQGTDQTQRRDGGRSRKGGVKKESCEVKTVLSLVQLAIAVEASLQSH